MREPTHVRGLSRANPREDKGSMDEKASILLVDDHANHRRTMSLILEHEGYLVTTASDGGQAVEEVTRRPFHVTFMDIRMSGMNGVDTFRRIREIRPEAVVIIMTAFDADDLIREAVQGGSYAVVYKPLDIPKALALIETASKPATLTPGARCVGAGAAYS